jgi:asparagine synthase (glutamine-hydrolysing)
VQAHRGPDGEGLWSTSIGATGVTLGQKRLAIQDLSSAGAQPMLSECGGYALNYNGELYNAVELRRLLEHEGAVFHGRCDTEVVLRALMHWGDAALERFNGMWALAFVDVERRLLLSRDRFGEKPLYCCYWKRPFLPSRNAIRPLPNPSSGNTRETIWPRSSLASPRYQPVSRSQPENT